MNTLPLAIQLYSLRKLPGSVDELLGEVAAAGYDGVETVGLQGLTGEEFAELLAKHNLKVTSSHVSLASLDEDFGGVVAGQKRAGNQHLVVPALPDALRTGDAEHWRAVGRRLGNLGRRCAEQRLKFSYHNHAFEMAEVEGKRALEWLLEAADPDHLSWEADLGWVVRGGAEPMDLLAKYEDRCPLIHVKDIAPAGQNEDEAGWADVGDGILDWAEVLARAKAAGTSWFVVEHDQPKDPLKTLKRCATYMRQLEASSHPNPG